MKKPNLLVMLAWFMAMFSARLSSQPAPSPNPVKKLLVIAPAAFQPVLQEFVAHKQTLLPTEFQSLEDILQKTSGVDDPEKLKRFLYAEWRQRRLGYVLLVGDVDVMPVRYMVLDRVTPAAFDYA